MINFYQGKRVLVTGHSGFKGSWLTVVLNTLGADAIGLSLPANTNPNHFDLLHCRREKNHFWVDITDLEKLDKVVGDVNPDMIFHLAAQSSVLEGYRTPIETFNVNALGTANILHVARKCSKTRAVVIVTSDKCYLNNENKKSFVETDRLGGFDPYSTSKACAELITDCFRSAFFSSDKFMSISTVRAGNVIGGGDWTPNRIMTDVIHALTTDKPLSIRNPSSVRPWQHVLDPLMGYLRLGELMYGDEKYGGAYNFGPASGSDKTVRELANQVSKFWDGLVIEHKNSLVSVEKEARNLVIDSSKAKASLGWRPYIDFEQAVSWTVEWYKKWHCHQETITQSQVNRYLEMIRVNGF